jgi:hypothetical protein
MLHLRIRNHPVRFGRVPTPIAMTASTVIRATVKISTRIPARTSALRLSGATDNGVLRPCPRRSVYPGSDSSRRSILLARSIVTDPRTLPSPVLITRTESTCSNKRIKVGTKIEGFEPFREKRALHDKDVHSRGLLDTLGIG